MGGQLNLIQKISLASFVYYGHEVKLYVYDDQIEVPEGVVKADANEIVPESEIFLHHRKLATFSDYFRYIMIKKTGEMWVDADTICFKENFFEDVDTVFIIEMNNPLIYAAGVLKLPQDSLILDELIEKGILIKNSIKESTLWGSLGPALFTELVKKHKLDHFGIPAELINLITNPFGSGDFWDPEHTQEIIDKSKVAYSGTFFNSALDMKGFTGKNTIVPGSAIEYFHNKFCLDSYDS